MHCPDSQQKGQALIVVLLVSAIGLTLGLSLVSRTTNESSIATEIEKSSRAFSAAEAGLEAASQQLGNFPAILAGVVESESGDANYEVEIERVGGTSNPYVFPGELQNNQPITVWLNDYVDRDLANRYQSSTLDLCWGETGGDTAAFEITFYYKTTGGTPTYYLSRDVYNPQGTIVVDGNTKQADTISGSSPDCGNSDFTHSANINLTTLTSAHPYIYGTHIPLMLKLRPIIIDGADSGTEATTRLGVSPAVGVDLPPQGEEHSSIGTTAGGQQTKLIQFISFPAPPEIFDTVIFSEDNLTK